MPVAAKARNSATGIARQGQLLSRDGGDTMAQVPKLKTDRKYKACRGRTHERANKAEEAW